MKPAWFFGLAGLIPFVALSGVAVIGPEQWHAVSRTLLNQYGALILSFVGALHWGYAVQQQTTGRTAWLLYGYSVVPALWAWWALQYPPLIGLQMLGLALMICLLADFALLKLVKVPLWLIRLRIVLTTGGAASLLVAGAF